MATAGKSSLARRALATTAALALAISGVVLAAPSASALSITPGPGPNLTDIVRSVPVPPSVTATAPRVNVGEVGQPVQNAEIKLPVDASHATWRPGDQLVLSLPTNVTWSAAPTVQVWTSDYASHPATGPGSTPGGTFPTPALVPTTLNNYAPTFEAVQLSGSQAILTFSNNQRGYAPGDSQYFATTFTNSPTATGTFYVELTGMQVDVAAGALGGPLGLTVSGNNVINDSYGTIGYATTPAVSTTICLSNPALNQASYVGGTTTIGWVIPAAISIPAMVSPIVPNSGLNPLPNVTITETVPNGLTDGSYTLQASQTSSSNVQQYLAFDNPTNNPPIPQFDAYATGDFTVTNFANSTPTMLTFDVVGQNPAVIQTMILHNLRVNTTNALTGQITLVLTPVIYPYLHDALNHKSYWECNNATSTFSQSPDDLTDFNASTTIPVPPNNVRIGGIDRYDTAALLADRFGHSLSVIVANGEQYKGGFDALSANYLAGEVDAPILLTMRDSVPDVTLQAVRNVLKFPSYSKRTIYVIGDQNSVSNAAAEQLRTAFQAAKTDVQIVRVSGADRYATSAAVTTLKGVTGIRKLTFDYGLPMVRTAIIATGQVTADALAAGPISYNGLPVLLTNGASLSTAVTDALQSMDIKQVLILGGTPSVATSVETQLNGLGITRITRIAGPDRFGTAADLWTFAFLPAPTVTQPHSGGLGFLNEGEYNIAFLANGYIFADALAAGPLAGSMGNAALLLTPQDVLAPATAAWLTSFKASIYEVIGLGQQPSLSQAVLTAASAAAN